MSNRRFFWRPRFSLRTLLIVTALVAVFAAWFTQWGVRQRWAVAELTKLGGDVVYEHKVSPKSISWCPERLRNWLGIDFFARATEVRFGDYSSHVRYPQRNAETTVVLSERSQKLQSARPRRIILVPFPPSPTVINDEVLQQACKLPYLRKLTIGMLTTTQAKNHPSIYGRRVDIFEFDAMSLQNLKGHPTLEELDLSAMEADDEVLAALHGFQNLKILWLGASAFSTEGAKHLESLTNLEEIHFELGPVHRRLTGNSQFPQWQITEDFPRLANLRVLRIPNRTFVNGGARLMEGKLPKLQSIDCGSLSLDDQGFEWFSSFSNLEELNLIDSRITDQAAVHLAKFTKVRKLILTNNRITDDGLRHLAGLEKLETLYLSYLPITDAGLAHLRDLTAIEVLMLPGTRITDSGIEHLSCMSQLYSLDLSFTSITDKSIDQLLCLKKLSNIRLLGTSVTRAGAKRLRQAFPSAKIVMPDAADPAP